MYKYKFPTGACIIKRQRLRFVYLNYKYAEIPPTSQRHP